MKRLKTLIRNLIIIAVLSLIFMKVNGIYFTPEAAFRASEKDLHGGPATIVHKIEKNGNAYLFTRYYDFYNCSRINPSFKYFWKYGGNPYGPENRKEERLSFAHTPMDGGYITFGLVNDEAIEKISLEAHGYNHEPVFLETDEFYQDLFYFFWEDDADFEYDYEKAKLILKGFDKAGQLIYEYKLSY